MQMASPGPSPLLPSGRVGALTLEPVVSAQKGKAPAY